MKSLSPRERRLVALGILVALIVGVLGLVVQPIADGFIERAAEREDLLAEYERNARVLDGTAAWRELAGRQAGDAATFALIAEDGPGAVSALQSRLGDVLSQEGATVRSVGERDAMRPDWVRVGAEVEMTLSQLYRSLERLEREDPYVLVESLAIAADRTTAIGEPSRLSVRLEIAAPIVVRPPQDGDPAGGNGG